MLSLFQSGDFRLHSGERSDWKIDCDALTNDDIATLAAQIAKKVGPFSHACGVPRGGMRLAAALVPYETGRQDQPALLVDDVLTTGASMEAIREQVEEAHLSTGVIGVVLFARRRPPDWIQAVWTLWE